MIPGASDPVTWGEVAFGFGLAAAAVLATTGVTYAWWVAAGCPGARERSR